MKKKCAAVYLAGALMLGTALGAGAAPSVIYGESETTAASETVASTDAGKTETASPLSQGAAQAGAVSQNSETEASTESDTKTSSGSGSSESGATPLNPVSEGITEAEAVTNARALYSKMKHYAELTDNDQFAACFEADVDASTIQAEMQSVKDAVKSTEDLDQHSDVCYADPTADKTLPSSYFGVGLTDYKVNNDGTVDWYSVILRVAKYEDGWKASALPDGAYFTGRYPEGFEQAQSSGRNAVDLYPYLAMRFSDEAVFTGAFYSLVNMAWQNEDGSLGLALWLANGQDGTKWCDSIDLVLSDGTKEVASVNAPVQQAIEGNQGKLVTVNIPAANVKTGTDQWSSLTIQSNLLYQ